ncbi:MAG: hypothetical protein AAGG75_02805 [Bacteroidota bacterium]
MENSASFNPSATTMSNGGKENRAVAVSPGGDNIVNITITSLEAIDKIIIGLCPQIVNLKAEEIESISSIINSYFFGKIADLSEITAILNIETIEFIEGIRMLIKEEKIINVHGLEEHFAIYIKAFEDINICGDEII